MLDWHDWIYSLYAERDRTPFVFPIPEQSMHPPITRVEALWQTLTADCIEEKHPAPIPYGCGFSNWVCKQVNRAIDLDQIISRYSLSINDVESGNLKDAKSRVGVKPISHCKLLNGGEMGGYYSPEELDIAKIELK